VEPETLREAPHASQWNDPLVGTTLGAYELLERAAAGGFATVYRARHALLDRPAAVKVLHPTMVRDSSVRERFRREAVSAARIIHPNVAMVFDFGETASGAPYLAMEWIDGPSLRQVMVEQGRLPLQRIAWILRGVASGLAEAHALGLLHRDLKASNVMIAEAEGGRATVKLVDFGLARPVEQLPGQGLTAVGTLVGTPEYMAPEIILSRPLTPACDLYAAGVLLYELLTGQLPFRGSGPSVLCSQVRDAPPPPPPAQGLGALALQLLQKEPQARPKSAEELIQRIDALTFEAEPPPRPASPPAPPPRGQTLSLIEVPPPELPPEDLDQTEHGGMMFPVGSDPTEHVAPHRLPSLKPVTYFPPRPSTPPPSFPLSPRDLWWLALALVSIGVIGGMLWWAGASDLNLEDASSPITIERPAPRGDFLKEGAAAVTQ
jgi:serine/threonine-protein kinase